MRRDRREEIIAQMEAEKRAEKKTREWLLQIPFYLIYAFGGGLCRAADQARRASGEVSLCGDCRTGHRIGVHRAGDVQ